MKQNKASREENGNSAFFKNQTFTLREGGDKIFSLCPQQLMVI